MGDLTSEVIYRSSGTCFLWRMKENNGNKRKFKVFWLVSYGVNQGFETFKSFEDARVFFNSLVDEADTIPF